MYHVSTMLPYSKDNPQQLERKRHIGNDIVNIVYTDDPDAIDTFNPNCIRSQFTRESFTSTLRSFFFHIVELDRSLFPYARIAFTNANRCICRGVGRTRRQRMACGHLLRRKCSSVWPKPSVSTGVRRPVHPARISARQVNKRREGHIQHADVRSEEGKNPRRSSPGHVSRTLAGEQEQRKFVQR